MNVEKKMSKEKEPEKEVYAPIHENVWTAQMTGTHFWRHHDAVDTDYNVNPDPRVDFSESDTF
jgi:hypothetical protein